MTARGDLLAFRAPGAREVYAAIIALNLANRTTNNSQIASKTQLSRQRVTEITAMLRSRGFIKDVGHGAAYHWRITNKPVPVET